MATPSPRSFRPRVEALETLRLPAVSTLALAHPVVNLRPTAVAASEKAYMIAFTPATGRQGGVVNLLSANAVNRTVTSSVSILYRTKLLPSYLSLFSPTVSFTMRVYFTTSLDDPRSADVKVSFSKNIVPFGSSIRDKVAVGVVDFLYANHDAIAATLAR